MCADDTTILASNDDVQVATKQTQTHLSHNAT